MKLNPKAALPLEKYPARMRVDQVALHLSCSEDHVCELIKTRRLPAVNIAASSAHRPIYRIDRAALAAFVQKAKRIP